MKKNWVVRLSLLMMLGSVPWNGICGNMWERSYYLKRIKQAKTTKDLLTIREYAEQRLQVLGFDIIGLADQRRKALGIKDSKQDQELARADELMLARRFSEAFESYQKVANAMKSARRWNVTRDWVFHSMARALYGAGRFEDAWNVYSWISIRYSAYQRILFEKMWTAFRLGRVDYALGSIASQRSYYYGEYLHPESYLIETYLYRRLCRNDDLKPVVVEMRRYQKLIESDQWEPWAQTDPETRALWWVSRDEQGPEADAIRAGLKKKFLAAKGLLLRQLKLAQAYSYLAEGAGAETMLKPIERLNDREAWLKRNLEIWPAVYPENVREEWADEVGSHRFLGESKCGVTQ